MKATRSIVIDAPLDRVWKTAAHDFDKIAAWASLVNTSEAAQDAVAPDGAEIAGRVCTTSFGQIYEKIETYDERRHSFTYVIEGMPSFMKRVANTWTLERLSDSQTRLTMSMEAELSFFPGMLMRPLMGPQSRKALDLNLEEIKHYIETGKPHPRKVKQIAKAL
ncbi:SRPBCC family protein [Chloroflexi bacterium TSY]|nr:SRPBCC family protein [Chloroflexi bacterium TSY]